LLTLLLLMTAHAMAKGSSADPSSGPCRVRLKLDIASAAGNDLLKAEASRSLLLAVPSRFRIAPISSFVRHLISRLCIVVPDIFLVVDGYVLHPSQRLCDVLAENDVLEVHVRGGVDVSRKVAAVAACNASASVPSVVAASCNSAGGPGPPAVSDATAGTRFDIEGGQHHQPATVREKPNAQKGRGRKRSWDPDDPKAGDGCTTGETGLAATGDQITPAFATIRSAAKQQPKQPQQLQPQQQTQQPQQQQQPQQHQRPPADDNVPKGQGPISFKHPLLGEIEVLEGEEVAKVVERKTRTLRKAVRRQVEYYFGEKNWQTDEHMRENANASGFVHLDVIMKFDRLRALTEEASFVRGCLEGSDIVELSKSGSLVRPRWLQLG